MFYMDIDAEAGASVALPGEHEERAVYVVSGAIELDGARHDAGTMVVVAPGGEVAFTTPGPARAMLLGGQSVGPRRVEWNFVAATQDRIEIAKADWVAGRFPRVPDEVEFIPLPGSPAAVSEGSPTS
jgi:redox-sensitive bicupin YhaK (pirin superfamily)